MRWAMPPAQTRISGSAVTAATGAAISGGIIVPNTPAAARSSANPISANRARNRTTNTSSGTFPRCSQPSQLSGDSGASGEWCRRASGEWCSRLSSQPVAVVPINSATPSITAMLKINRLATANGQVSGVKRRFMAGCPVAGSCGCLPRSAAGLPRELELGESFLDAVGALQILQLAQFGGVAGFRRSQPAEAGLLCQDAIEHGAGIGHPILAFAASGGPCGRTRAGGVAGAGGDIVAQRLLHLAFLGEERGDITLEFLARVALIGERLLQDRQLLLDIELLFDPGAGQIFASLAERRFDLAGELLVLGIELVELARRQVLRRLDTAELGPHIVDDAVDLADRLPHRRLGRGVLDRVEERMNAAADHAGHAAGYRVGHDCVSFRVSRLAVISCTSSMMRGRCFSITS